MIDQLQLVPLTPGTPSLLLGPRSGFAESLLRASSAGAPIAAGLRPLGEDGSRVLLLAASDELLVNGLEIGALKSLRPGDLVSLPPAEWMLVRRYRAGAGPAPRELASRTCPYCGIELDAAPVAACHCGTFYHYEDEEEGKAPEERLTCFLASPRCSQCGQVKSFADQLIPDPGQRGFPVRAAAAGGRQ